MMCKTPNLTTALAATLLLAGCFQTGESKTLAKYTDAQIERCERSLTFRERDEAQRNAKAKMMSRAMIPIVGVFMIDGSEEYFQEVERICKRKGIV